MLSYFSLLQIETLRESFLIIDKFHNQGEDRLRISASSSASSAAINIQQGPNMESRRIHALLWLQCILLWKRSPSPQLLTNQNCCIFVQWLLNTSFTFFLCLCAAFMSSGPPLSCLYDSWMKQTGFKKELIVQGYNAVQCGRQTQRPSLNNMSRETALNVTIEGGVKRIRRGSIRNMQSADASFLFLRPWVKSSPSQGCEKSSHSLKDAALKECEFRKYPLWCIRNVSEIFHWDV